MMLAIQLLFLMCSSSRQKMIEDNRGLVHFFANKLYSNCNKNEFCVNEDLLQQGHYGLIRAVDKYDKNRGIAFSTYAGYWIRAYMKKYIDSVNHIHIPDKKRKTHPVFKLQFYDTQEAYETDGLLHNAHTMYYDKEQIDDLLLTLYRLELSVDEKIMLQKRFYESMTYTEFGKKFNKSKSHVQYKYAKLYSKISNSKK